MYYVYIIRSYSHSDRMYIGYTTNLSKRLEAHNTHNSFSTANQGPWELIVCITFVNMNKAKHFEKYLKSHAGRIFMQKRFV
jgi:putative endonuclease